MEEDFRCPRYQGSRLPDYVKIDVEGMDSKIIQSLTRRPRIVSFEMLPGSASATTCAVRHLAGNLDYQWFAFSEELSYKLTDWVRLPIYAPISVRTPASAETCLRGRQNEPTKLGAPSRLRRRSRRLQGSSWSAVRGGQKQA